MLNSPRQEEAGPILTLEECVNRALARGFDLEIERQSLSIAQDNVPIARSNFLPIFSATTGKSVTRTAIDPDFGLPATMNSTVDAGAGVSQRLLTGTQFSLDLNNNHFDTDPAIAALEPRVLLGCHARRETAVAQRLRHAHQLAGDPPRGAGSRRRR